MKIGIIGGAFNPPTWGHVRMAQVASSYVDEVWLQPCFNHMFGKNMASPQQRIEMCRLAVRETDRTSVSPYEVEQKLDCCTYDMLRLLEKQIPGQYYFVIGQDNANEIEKWKHHKQLIKKFPFIVIPRIGFVSDRDWYKQSPHIFVKDAALPEVSSTEVRDLLLKRHNSEIIRILRQKSPKRVIDYICHYGLYERKIMTKLKLVIMQEYEVNTRL